jgi:hypothetical protein
LKQSSVDGPAVLMRCGKRTQAVKSRHFLSTSLCVCLLFPALGHAKPPASESDRQRAVEHFKLGNQAFAEGDSLQAYTEYTAAWSFHESFDIACNLGRTEAELGKSRDAAEHLAYCLANFSASARPEIRSAEGKLREVFAEVTKQVASLTLQVQPDGAVVRIDGSIVGKAPLRRDLYLDVGKHEVDVRMTGYESVKRVVQASRAEHQELLLELHQDSGAAVAAEQPGEQQDESLGQATPAPVDPTRDAPAGQGGIPTRTIAVLTTGGLALVGLGVGGAYWFESQRLDDEVREARGVADDALGKGGCGVDPTAIECVRLNRRIDDRDRANTLSTIGLVAGSALALGTVAAYVWWPTSTARGTGAQTPFELNWSPVASTDEMGLVVWGRL